MTKHRRKKLQHSVTTSQVNGKQQSPQPVQRQDSRSLAVHAVMKHRRRQLMQQDTLPVNGLQPETVHVKRFSCVLSAVRSLIQELSDITPLR